MAVTPPRQQRLSTVGEMELACFLPAPVSGLGCEAGRVRRSHPNARAMAPTQVEGRWVLVAGSGALGAGGVVSLGCLWGVGGGTGPTAGETGPPVEAAVRATAANLTIYSASAVHVANFR